MKKHQLNKKEKDAVMQAVAEAEKKTSGEISTALIRESSDYIFYEFVFALALGLLSALLVVIFGNSWYQFLHRISWSMGPVLFNGISIGLVFLVMGAGFLVANTPWMDRLIVPASVRAQKVKQRAMLHFYGSGLTETDQRCAVLIFISFNERRVELIADSGISSKIEPRIWQDMVSDLTDQISMGNTGKGIEDAVKHCGALMAEYFPLKGSRKNQLSNSLQILED